MRKLHELVRLAAIGCLLALAGCQPASAPSTALATPTLPPSMAAPTAAAATPTPASTGTPSAAVTPLCRPASPAAGWECREYTDGVGRLRARSCGPATPAEAAWLCYEDLDLGLALEYPAGLELQRGSMIVPKEPTGHVGRVEFAGAGRGFTLDVWLSSEPDLAAWLEKMDRIAVSWSLPVTQPNATVGGRPAIAFAENPETAPGSLTVYFRDGAYVYRLWRWGLCYRQGERLVNDLPIVRRILDSIRFSPEPVPTQIPDSFWQEATRKCTPSLFFCTFAAGTCRSMRGALAGVLGGARASAVGRPH